MYKYMGGGGGLIHKKQNNKRLYNTYMFCFIYHLFLICKYSLFSSILFPTTPEEWKKIADRFQERWNFPNCLGAIDGKLVNIKTPVNSGSQFFNYKHSFFNYKHSFSVVMMVLVDADYKFIYCDVGCNGRISDGGVFGGCSLDEAMQNKTANIPKPQHAPGDGRPISYFMVADEAFPFEKPY